MTRVGASQAFFNIVASFNADKLIKDVGSLKTIMNAVALDTTEALLKPFDEFGQQIQAVVDATKDLGMEVGFARTEFEKFFGTGAMMESMANDIERMGMAFGFTAVESLAAGSRAAQVANLIGKANVDLLVEQAMILAEISDLNVEEAQRGMIKLQQQAGILYERENEGMFRGMSLMQQQIMLRENSAKALDALNTIANRSVALEGDLIQTMTNFASQGHLVGESFEFMAAAAATLLEAGEEQGTAGRALRMMYARLGGNISGAADQIEALGIQVRDSNGDMLTMQEVLGNVSAMGWDKMNASLKMNIAQTISGNRHYVRFIKLMDGYERTVRLAEDGQRGLDSAVKQSNRALAKQAHDLKEAEVRVENLKAAIGERLTPSMIGATKVEGDYLQVTSDLMRGLGNLGEVFGRLSKSIQVTGGMLKFGLALQSVGVGIGMYESVMKSLHGIEVANASLHSKQANYLEYGVKLAREEKYLQEAMQYLQQKMNASSEQSRMHQLALNGLLREEKQLKEIIDPLEEKTNNNLTKRANVSQKITSLQILQNDLSKRQMNSLQTKQAYLDHDYRTQGNLLERQKELYSERTFAEEAYKRQFIADVNTMSSLRAGDIKQIKEGNEQLRLRHSALQDLKAANEAARAARNAENEGEIRTAKLRSQDVKALEKYIAAERKFVDVKVESNDEESDTYKIYKARQDGLKQLSTELKNMEGGLFKVGVNSGLAKDGFTELKQALEQTGGQIIQSDRVLQAYNSTLLENGSIDKNLQILRGMKTKTNKELLTDQAKLNQLMDNDKVLKEQIQPLLDAIAQHDDEKIERSQEFIELTRILMGLEGDYAAIKEKYADDDARMQQRKTQDMAKFSMSVRRSVFALSNFTSMAGGAMGGTYGVAASMAAMSTQFAFGAFEVGKATVALRKSSMALMMQSGYFASARTAAMAYTAAIFAATAAVAAFTLVLVAVAKKAEKTRNTLADMAEDAAQFQDTFQSMEADTKLFGDKDELANEFGLANMQLAELYGNTELIDATLANIEQSGKNYTGELAAQLSKTESMLLMLKNMESENVTVIDEEAFDKDYQRIMTIMEGNASRSFDNLMAGTGGGAGRKAARSFMESMDKEMTTMQKADSDIPFFGGIINAVDDVIDDNWGVTGEAQFEIIEAAMEQLRDVGMLTEDQWEDLTTALGDSQWAADVMSGLESMATYVRTTDDASATNDRFQTGLDDMADVINSVDNDLKNLTDDITNFSNAREELFYGGKYGNVTGSLYKQVVQQGVGVLYNKQEVIVSNNFHGFFNEQEAAFKISNIVKQVLTNGTV